MLHGLLGYIVSTQNSNLEVICLSAKLVGVQNIENPDSQIVTATVVPWSLLAALLYWIYSVLLILVLPSLAIVPYALAKGIETTALSEFFATDKNVLLISVGAIVPAHLLTLGGAWMLVSQVWNRKFFKTLGWEMGGFKFWHCALTLIGVFGLAAIVGHYFPEEENQMIKLLRSSKEATILVALIATFSAPFVEEVVYRGILYSAAEKTVGKAGAVSLVTFLFVLVHVPQYYPSYSTILLLSVLSLTLTIVRARTGKLLPAVVLHFLFNGIQSFLLVASWYLPLEAGGIQNAFLK